MVYKRMSKSKKVRSRRSKKVRSRRSKKVRCRKSRIRKSKKKVRSRKSKKNDGRQNIKRANLEEVIDRRMYIEEGEEEIRRQIQAISQNEYFSFLIDITVAGVFLGKDFIIVYEDDSKSATVTTTEDRISYSIKLINIDQRRLKISILQNGHIVPYVSDFIYRNSVNIISDIGNYVRYTRNQLF